MSYSDSFPTQRPSLNLVFNGGSDQLDSRISYSRSSSGTVFSSEKHLSSENTQTNSDSLSDWTGQTATLAGSQVGPDGTTTNAAILTGTAGTGIKGIWEGLQNIEQTISWHAKEGTHRYIQLYVTGDGSKYVNFDLNGSGAVSANGSGVTASITASGNGYLRCAVKLTIPDTYAYITLQDSLSAARAASTSSTGTVYLFGIQSTTLGDATNVAAYVATGSQIHRSYSSTLKSYSSDQPRFEYSAADGQSEGLLIEQQSTNLTVSSQQAENWSPQEATVQPNVAIAPDGTLGADKLTESGTASSTHWIYKSSALGVAVGTTAYTISFYAKAAGRTSLQSYDNNQVTGGNIVVDLTNGSITSGAGKVESVGNGWYRISYQAVADYSTNSTVRILMQDAGSITYDGDGYSGILLWGMQVEIGSAPTSYIKTTTSATATRSADSCSVVDATLFSSGEHTIIWEGDTDPTSSDKRFFALSDGSLNNRFVADYDNGTTTRLRNWADDVNNVGMSTSTVDMLVGSHKLAATLKTNECQLVIDGTRQQVDTSCVVGSGIDQLAINSTTTGAGPTYNMNGHCKRITYYNVALSQAEAEALTSNP